MNKKCECVNKVNEVKIVKIARNKKGCKENHW